MTYNLVWECTREQFKDPELYWEIEKWAKEFLAEMERRANDEERSRKETELAIKQGRGMKEL